MRSSRNKSNCARAPILPLPSVFRGTIASAASCQVSATYDSPGFIVAAVFSPPHWGRGPIQQSFVRGRCHPQPMRRHEPLVCYRINRQLSLQRRRRSTEVIFSDRGNRAMLIVTIKHSTSRGPIGKTRQPSSEEACPARIVSHLIGRTTATPRAPEIKRVSDAQ
jgi:hypothetical protein